MRAIFRKMAKKAKKGEIFEDLGKNVENLKNNLKKGSLTCANVALLNQLEYALGKTTKSLKIL